MRRRNYVMRQCTAGQPLDPPPAVIATNGSRRYVRDRQGKESHPDGNDDLAAVQTAQTECQVPGCAAAAACAPRRKRRAPGPWRPGPGHGPACQAGAPRLYPQARLDPRVETQPFKPSPTVATKRHPAEKHNTTTRAGGARSGRAAGLSQLLPRREAGESQPSGSRAFVAYQLVTQSSQPACVQQ